MTDDTEPSEPAPDSAPPDPAPPDPAPTAKKPDDPMRLARELADGYRSTDPGSVPRRRRRGQRPVHRRSDRDDAMPLSAALGDLVDQQGWTDQLAASRVFTDWAAIVGPDIAQHSLVEGFADQVVAVRADSSAWRKELQLLAPRIVARLNEELGHGSVLRIDVRGPEAPSWKHGKRTVRGGRGPRDTYG